MLMALRMILTRNMYKALKSSSIDGANYNEIKRELILHFNDGSKYTYHGVPQHIVDGLHLAKSAGAYHTTLIRNNYKATKH